MQIACSVVRTVAWCRPAFKTEHWFTWYWHTKIVTKITTLKSRLHAKLTKASYFVAQDESFYLDTKWEIQAWDQQSLRFETIRAGGTSGLKNVYRPGQNHLGCRLFIFPLSLAIVVAETGQHARCQVQSRYSKPQPAKTKRHIWRFYVTACVK